MLNIIFQYHISYELISMMWYEHIEHIISQSCESREEEIKGGAKLSLRYKNLF